MINLLDPVFWTNLIDTAVKPPVFATSDFIFNITLFFATFFSIFFYFITLDGLSTRKIAPHFRELIRFPMVTVQIPTYNEPVAVRCAEKCLEFDYPKDKYEVIIGDDSRDKSVSAFIDAFAAKCKGKVKVTRRGENIGYKAGNLNHMLKYSKGEIIVVFDSDFVPPKNFLKEVVKPFGSDRKIGGVQARWDFLNTKQSIISKLAAGTLMVYHHLIMPVFNKNNVSFICGSAEAVRKDVLVKLGGWQNGSLTEDTEFSIRMMKSGYRTVYLQDLLVKGEVPYNFKSFKKQQMRWAYGSTSAFLQHSKDILFSSIFNIRQKALISMTILGYITAPLFVALFLTGMLSFATNVPGPIDVPKFLFSLGENLFLTSGFIFAILMGFSRYGSYGKMTPTLAASIIISSLTVGVLISFYVAKGFVKALMGRPMQWHIVQKSGNEEIMPRHRI
jgi:cellulose synthase/poly-beta-1,6-N-acetylglucosamine synthase-like glycosyltransferase